MEVGGAVHGQAGDAVQEVSEGEVDYEDGGVLERSSMEAECLVCLSPGDCQESEEVARSSNDSDNDAEDPGHGGQQDREGVMRLGTGAAVTGLTAVFSQVSHCQAGTSNTRAALQTTELQGEREREREGEL